MEIIDNHCNENETETAEETQEPQHATSNSDKEIMEDKPDDTIEDRQTNEVVAVTTEDTQGVAGSDKPSTDHEETVKLQETVPGIEIGNENTVSPDEIVLDSGEIQENDTKDVDLITDNNFNGKHLLYAILKESRNAFKLVLNVCSRCPNCFQTIAQRVVLELQR